MRHSFFCCFDIYFAFESWFFFTFTTHLSVGCVCGTHFLQGRQQHRPPWYLCFFILFFKFFCAYSRLTDTDTDTHTDTHSTNTAVLLLLYYVPWRRVQTEWGAGSCCFTTAALLLLLYYCCFTTALLRALKACVNRMRCGKLRPYKSKPRPKTCSKKQKK